jgi:hypothetical protein
LIGFFLQGGIAHVLTECFKRAHNPHEHATNWDTHDSHGEDDDPPAASIHCINPQLYLGLAVAPSPQNLSKRSAKSLVPWWSGAITPVGTNAGDGPPINWRIDLNSYHHASAYLVFSVLRI